MPYSDHSRGRSASGRLGHDNQSVFHFRQQGSYEEYNKAPTDRQKYASNSKHKQTNKDRKEQKREKSAENLLQHTFIQTSN